MLRRLTFLALLTSACLHHAAPPVGDPDGAAEALAKRDGPFAVDAKGVWQPIVDSAVRFVGERGARVRLLGLDANPQGVVVALAHEGGVAMKGVHLAGGAGVLLARLDPAGAPRWKLDFQGGRMELLRLRLADDGAVVLNARSDGHVVPERGTLESDDFVYVVDNEAAKPWSTGWFHDRYGRTTAVEARGYRKLVQAGELDGPRPGVEPWQAYVEGMDLPRQVFGSDQPVHVSYLSTYEDWTVLAGSFEGTLAAGGRPPIQSRARTAFVAALEPEGRVAWLAPIYPPAPGATLEPLALRADADGIHLGLAALLPGGARSLIAAELGGDGTVVSSCELGQGEALDLGFAGELTYLLGADGARFFGPGCQLQARLVARPGERVAALRPVDTRVLVGVDTGAGSELRWLRK